MARYRTNAKVKKGERYTLRPYRGQASEVEVTRVACLVAGDDTTRKVWYKECTGVLRGRMQEADFLQQAVRDGTEYPKQEERPDPEPKGWEEATHATQAALDKANAELEGLRPLMTLMVEFLDSNAIRLNGDLDIRAESKALVRAGRKALAGDNSCGECGAPEADCLCGTYGR